MSVAIRIGFVALLGLMLSPTSAAAASHFVFANGRPVGVTIGSTFRLFTLVGWNDGVARLASKTTTGDWIAASPGGPSNMYFGSSVASTGATTFGGPPRLYVIANSTPAALWEYAPNSDGSGSWRNISNGAGPVLSNTPQTAAGVDHYGNVVVAVRASNGHVWTCWVPSATQNCAWTDGSIIGGTYLADTNGPIGVNPSSFNNTFEIYSIAGSGGSFSPPGALQRWTWGGSWDNVGVPPSPVGTTVDFVGIQARTVSGYTDVVVAGWDHMSAGDTLQLAQITSGTGWSWHNLGGPSAGFSYSLNNIAWGTNGITDMIWVETLGGQALWRCQLSGSSCAQWQNVGAPVDERPGWDGLGGGVWGDVSHAYVTGTLNLAQDYIYGYNTGWENHLTYRSQTTNLPNTDPVTGITLNLGEYAAQEYYGTVAVTASHLIYNQSIRTAFWISQDDGSSFSGPTFPFEGTSANCLNNNNCSQGDESVAYDASGDLYVSVIAPSILVVPVRINRRDAGVWETPFIVPPAVASNLDRPMMVADRLLPGTLYMTFAAATANNFVYCDQSADCARSSATWCPTSGVAYSLPSASNCQAIFPPGTNPQTAAGVGCPLTQAGDGQLWVAINDDSSCPANDFGGTYPPFCSSSSCDLSTPRTRAIGIRQLNPTHGSCSPGSQAPVSAVPECLYYVQPALTQLRPSATDFFGQANGPGMYRHWGAVLSAARDSGVISLTLESARDIATGQPCSTGSACRMEVYFATRIPGSGWCGANCQSGGPWNLSNMLVVNTDTYLHRQTDHIRGSPVLLDYGQALITWLDWRDDLSDVGYAFRTASMQVGSLASSEFETPAWPSTNAGRFSLSGGNWFGDVNVQANARLHGHFFNEMSVPGSSTVVPASSVQSPSAMIGR